MVSESITHSVFGRMGYWLRGHEGKRNNSFSKIQLVGQKYWDKATLASKTQFAGGTLRFQIDRRIISLYYLLPVSLLYRFKATASNTPWN